MKSLIFFLPFIGMIYLGFVISSKQDEINQLKLQIKDQNEEIQTQVSEAYQDCQRFMIIDKRIQRINGCYSILELLCSETNKPKTCLEAFAPRCGEIGDE